jgi:hypothetical protein
MASHLLDLLLYHLTSWLGSVCSVAQDLTNLCKIPGMHIL